MLKYLRRLRNLPESIMHARRRRDARHRLQGARPGSVLFICTGNICRSPFAAELFRNVLPAWERERVSVSSAGYVGPGRPAPREARTAAQQYGLDLEAHRSASISGQALKDADLVVVMAPDHGRGLRERMRRDSLGVLVLGDLDPDPIVRRTIEDPWGCEQSVFDSSYARIHRCVVELVRVLTT